MGRPKKYNTPEEMQVVIENYFKDCEIREDPLTIEGLADALDLDRKSIINYSKDDRFFHTIKKAKEKINNNFAMRALRGDYNPTISIFLMKNNFGYVDKQEQEVKQHQVNYYAPVKDQNN